MKHFVALIEVVTIFALSLIILLRLDFTWRNSTASL